MTAQFGYDAQTRYVAGPKFSGPDAAFPGDELFHLGSRSAGEVAQDWLGTSLTAIASGVLVRHWVTSTGDRRDITSAAAGALTGVYLADLGSGILHWAFDTWFDEDIAPLRRVILIVREHHIYPQRIFKYGLGQDIGLMSWFGVGVSGPIAVMTLSKSLRDPGVALSSFAVTYSTLISLSLELHKFGHTFGPSPLVAVAQRSGLLLTPRHHMKHHKGEHDENYCLVNGWADQTLGKLGLFRALERLVVRLNGEQPRRDDRRWRRLFGRPVRSLGLKAPPTL